MFILCPFVLVFFGRSSVCLFLPLFFPCFLSSFIRFVVHWFCCFITVFMFRVFSFLHSSVPVFLVFLILYVFNSGLLGQYSSVSTIRGPIEAHYSVTLLFLGQNGAKKKIFQRSLGSPPSDYWALPRKIIFSFFLIYWWRQVLQRNQVLNELIPFFTLWEGTFSSVLIAFFHTCTYWQAAL